MKDALRTLVADRGYYKFDLAAWPLHSALRTLRQENFVTKTELTVKTTAEARDRSLSKKYGENAFPFHTDFAFRAQPPRYLLLVNDSEQASSRATLVSRVSDLRSDWQRLLKRSQWKLTPRSGHSVIVSGFVARTIPGFWRFDADALEPFDDTARVCLKELPSKFAQNAESFEWSAHSALLIDNWACVHARAGNPGIDNERRSLTRYEVWQDARMDN